jgi:hypothetical protein
MSTPAEMNERHGRILAKLSELSLTLAVDLHARALAAEDTDEVAELVNAFQKITRGVRQTMALEARLHRDGAIAAREAAVEDERTRPARIERRKAEVRAAVERLIWTEVERDETFEDDDDPELTVGPVGDLLMEELADEDFADTPVAVLVERIKVNLATTLAEFLAPPEPELRNSA